MAYFHGARYEIFLSEGKNPHTDGGCAILLTAGQVAASSCLFSALGGDGQGLESAWGGPHIRAHTERSGVWARTGLNMKRSVYTGRRFLQLCCSRIFGSAFYLIFLKRRIRKFGGLGRHQSFLDSRT